LITFETKQIKLFADSERGKAFVYHGT